ncbi:conserved hypothetical protein [Culex quinquefasciatus]|uniref:Uncharacterized protein n=1 Tax=Culex quinquefasciatus TaxID=7176 RepID=B0W8Q1_CULQU|nr:conserved hypothetical protein [Culex quinquefasciatus]|eukprot:XP_001845085.1 conserved hypothetical protein [Culex quinquefasciatus]
MEVEFLGDVPQEERSQVELAEILSFFNSFPPADLLPQTELDMHNWPLELKDSSSFFGGVFPSAGRSMTVAAGGNKREQPFPGVEGQPYLLRFGSSGESNSSLEWEDNLFIHDVVSPEKRWPQLESLLQRERQLLICNVNQNGLDLLRKRQLTLVMDIITSDKNESPAKAPNTRLCKKCSRVKVLAKFPLDTRQTSASICERCTDLQGPAVDIAIYRSILRSIRRDEKKRGALASYAFIIQDNDIKHIVERIWHGHSAISNETNRAELRLVRWDIRSDWSPWNCICLTESEARAHLRIVHLDRYYEASIFKEITNKHALSKHTFKQLRDIDQVFVESGTWWKVGLGGSCK